MQCKSKNEAFVEIQLPVIKLGQWFLIFFVSFTFQRNKKLFFTQQCLVCQGMIFLERCQGRFSCKTL